MNLTNLLLFLILVTLATYTFMPWKGIDKGGLTKIFGQLPNNPSSLNVWLEWGSFTEYLKSFVILITPNPILFALDIIWDS